MGIKRGSTDVGTIYRGINQVYKIYQGSTQVYDSGLDPDAIAFYAATGITDSTQRTAINQLVLDLKDANLWDKLQIIYPFVGGTANAHKYNLKDPRDLDAAYRLTFNGGFVHDANGSRLTEAANGDGGDTHWIPSDQTFTNGVHWSINIYAEDPTISSYNMGIAQGGKDWALINGLLSGSNDYWQAGTGGYLSSTSPSELTHIIGTSNGTDYRAIYEDGSLLISSTAGGIDTTVNISAFMWAVHLDTGSAEHSYDTVNFATFGQYLDSTEAAALTTAQETFNTTLSR